jgi:aminoglycoside phosphotransferase (APT) family kinase protein
MGTLESYLPPDLATETIAQLVLSLNLPVPATVERLEVSAAFHSIYLITFPASSASEIPARPNRDGSVTLVLRVSGRQLPSIKTRNEVGVIKWVREKTKIPIPAIIRYDDTESNVVGHEFTLLEKVPGVSVDQIYSTLSQEARTKLVNQLVDYLRELHSHPWRDGFVGGLAIHGAEVAAGPPIEENFWQAPDLDRYWAELGETLKSLNPIPEAGFSNYVDFTVGCLDRYIHAIQKHPSLEPFRDMIPRVRAFMKTIQDPENAEELNRVTYVLAHKDLHFGNVMCDPDHPDCPITAILDWEFSGVVPAPRWNPPRAFLWNTKTSPEDKVEQSRMEEVFQAVCRERGLGKMLDEMRLSPRQESMQTVVNHIRAIVEVCPRGQAQDRVGHWRKIAETGMEDFGVQFPGINLALRHYARQTLSFSCFSLDSTPA